MPESLHQQLCEAATRLKRKKAAVVRMALEQALKDLDDDAVVG
jgi:predicted DNA-binding protein